MARGMAIAIAALCVLLVYAVISESIAAAITPAEPDIALLWRPGDAGALQAKAEAGVGEALTESEIRSATRAAEAALKAAPLTTASVRTLAEARQLSGDSSSAEGLMSLAGMRNLRDSKAQLWLFGRDMDARRYEQAFQHADLLMRRHGDLSAIIYPRLVANLDQPAARAAFLGLMRNNPSWRADFIRVQSEIGDPSGLTLWLLSNLTSAPHPPTEQEVNYIAQSLAVRERWADVRALLASYGLANKALLFNGDFERPNRAPPFGWRLGQNDNSVASIERIDGSENHGIYAEFPVGRSSGLTEQLLVLTPGRYRFSGRAKVDALPSDALFRWEVLCSGAPPAIGVSEQTISGGWTKFETAFDVPPAGCEAQWLRLTGTGGVGYAPARAWYDDLRLERLP